MEEIYIKEKTLKTIFPVDLKNVLSDGSELCAISADPTDSYNYYLNREKKTTRSKKTGKYIEKLSIAMAACYITEIVGENSYVSLIIDEKAYSFGIVKSFGTTMLIIKDGRSARGVDLDENDTMAVTDEILNAIGREAMESDCVRIDLPGSAFNMLSVKNMYNILLEDYIYINGSKFVDAGAVDFEIDEKELPIFA